ncbi:MAG: ComF family protein [Bermanella sp.]
MLTIYFRQSTTSILGVYKRLLNSQCIYCLQASASNICLDCQAALPTLGQHCPKCSEPNHHGQLCGHCLQQPPAFDEVICPFVFQPPISDLIHRWKKRPHALGVELLVQRLLASLSEHEFDAVMAVPYYWKKLLWRGHNPVRKLAKQISKQLHTPLLDAISRSQSGHAQRGLGRKQRLKNLRGVFALKPKYKAQLRHKNILLVDDVVTTGATCNHISKLLKAAGAQSTTLACLARTAPSS